MTMSQSVDLFRFCSVFATPCVNSASVATQRANPAWMKLTAKQKFGGISHVVHQQLFFVYLHKSFLLNCKLVKWIDMTEKALRSFSPLFGISREAFIPLSHSLISIISLLPFKCVVQVSKDWNPSAVCCAKPCKPFYITENHLVYWIFVAYYILRFKCCVL